MTRPDRYFRAGVGAVITGGGGRVLVLERRDVTGAWQFPQGGLEPREEPRDAAYREIHEETGIPESALRLLRRYPEPLAYELPANAMSTKTGMGQVQYWFLFRLKDPSTAIDLPRDSEFVAARWVSFAQAVSRAVGFRRPVYRRLRNEFGPAISKTGRPSR